MKKVVCLEHFFNHFKDDANECVALALQNLKRTASIIETFKMISTSRDDDSLLQTPLNELLQHAVREIHVSHSFDSEHVEINCPQDLVLTTYVDTLQRVIMQLIENSIKHAFEEYSQVLVKIDAKGLDDEIQIVYQDFGKGMDEKTVNQVFDPFYTTKRGRNVGLGMHIVYNQVVHILQGTIACESQINKGTRFTIKLPLTL